MSGRIAARLAKRSALTTLSTVATARRFGWSGAGQEKPR